ncbi:MFS transporter [Pseudofrankia inefficax]|uniref:Major facilitator superfamily MFS_1 n=1 Tax=Pseudofrankia inefficax (strain DSM 45817 / CECT 9037 / DDB 130130 / EuI1c) TaxID=298654 RepID=E3J480_PSEI1|nr:MFS transporter [Pseudofrankia inefficax]ADP81859.1 major facilitator superfamily MFS_1 [Pseudofrankia inefficax]
MTQALTSDAVGAPRSLRAVWPAMVGLSAVFLVEMLDNTLLNVALPTIGRDLRASTTQLQWVTGSYTVVFGGLMLFFGAVADRFGRRRVMFVGLGLLAVASFGTLFVRTADELIVVRLVMGTAAAMTAPGSMALSFRLFDQDALRMRASAVISSVGLVGVAVGPTVAGLLLAVTPWQVLLVVNAPVAVLAAIGIRAGIPADTAEDLHRDPIDVPGAVLGTLTIALALVAPTLFVQIGAGSRLAWACAAGAVVSAGCFVLRERAARHPLVDLRLVARPLVASGLAYQSALGLATAGLTYTVTLQLQLAWGWSPALAAVGMFPLVITMIVIGPFVDRIVDGLGAGRSTTLGATAVVAGLAIYGLLGRSGYGWIAVALVLVSAGMRVVMITSAVNVLRGLPPERTSLGAALSDTAQEVSNAIGVAVSGTVLAAIFVGDIASPHWTNAQVSQFQNAVTIAILALAAVAAALVIAAPLRARASRASTAATSEA